MMKRFLLSVNFLLILVFTGISDVSFAQKRTSKANLQAQSKKLESQIQYNNRLLRDISKSKAANLDRLSVLGDLIDKRNQLIRTINTEISTVDNDIQQYEKQIITLENEIQALKKEYAKMLVSTRRHTNATARLMFIVASESFNQAYRRLKYFQQYSAHRKEQVTLIRQKQEQLSQIKINLEQDKQSKTQLLSKEQQERKTLDDEKNKKNQTLSELQKKEKQLRADLAKKQAEAKKLTQQIERIIAQEMEAQRKAAAKKAAEIAAKKGTAAPKTSTKPAAADVYTLTPEQQKLSTDFVNNRGKLPWPTERGVITEYFGVHEHPALKDVRVNNDGIDITTGKGEVVRAVFDGVVTGVYPAPYDARTVIIRHGSYLTVYSNLKSVSVKKGQKITTKQAIGVVNTYDEKTILKFQLWKDMQKLNPAQWISAR